MRRLARRVRDYLAAPSLDAMKHSPDAATQIQLKLAYQALVADRRPLPKFSEVGFTCNSQTDEDGILLFVFSIVGTSKKLSVEISAGDGLECNTTNLILNHGWYGLLVDGGRANVERGARFFARSKLTYVYPPRFVHAWVTKSNVNQLLTTNGFSGEIDLLSVDVDGIDYWLWESIESVTPRVVVVEYQNILGPERSWTVPYADDFSSARYPMTAGQPNFAGASLAAFVKLGRRKGYRLVGVNRYCYNAFFIRYGLADNMLPEIDVRECFGHPQVAWGMRERFPTVKDLPWLEV